MISRRNTFIAILLVISLVAGGLIGFYFYTKNKNPGSTILGGKTGTNFGGYNPNSIGTNNRTGSSTPILPAGTIQEVKIPKLRLISANPVAGSDFITIPVYPEPPKVIKNIEPADSPTASSTSVKKSVKAPVLKPISTRQTIRYIERGTSHIFETATNTLETNRLSNFTETKIYEGYFVNNGDNLILRNLIGNSDTINTRYGSLIKASTSESLDMSLDLKDLPVNISQIAISPSKTKLFSIMTDGIRGIFSNIDGGSAVGLFNTPFKEWLATWPTENKILLNTKPSGFAPGFAYTLDTQTKNITRILGDIYGLTTLASPDLSTILFSESTAGQFTLNAYDSQYGFRYQVPLRTLPEKCIWAKTERSVIYCAVPENIAFSTYPDVWYQGQINFADSIWKYNLQTGESREISNLQDEFGVVIDATNLSISPSDDYLVFTNKVDLTLWGIQLIEPVKNIVINPLDSINSSSTSNSTASSTR